MIPSNTICAKCGFAKRVLFRSAVCADGSIVHGMTECPLFQEEKGDYTDYEVKSKTLELQKESEELRGIIASLNGEIKSAAERITLYQSEIKQLKLKQPTHQFKVGDTVWVSAVNFTISLNQKANAL